MSTKDKANAGNGLLFIGPMIAIAFVGILMFGRGPDIGANGAISAPSVVTAAIADTTSSSSEFSSSQKSAIEKIVKDYLLANPEVLLEVQAALEIKMAKEEAERTKKLVKENSDEIFRAPGVPVAGNPDGKITVVEFFDYNCGYCKRGFVEVAKLLEKDKSLRFVFLEFPILREESEQAARVALAANMQGKYWEVHRALLTSRGLINEEVALAAAEKNGLDMARLKTDMQSDTVSNELERVKLLANKLGINGTPHFLVGDRAIGGAPGNLVELIEQHAVDLRKEGCTYC